MGTQAREANQRNIFDPLSPVIGPLHRAGPGHGMTAHSASTFFVAWWAGGSGR